MPVQDYLDKHMLSRKIEDAVNAAVRAKASDPVLFISNHMKKAVPSVITKVKARQILDSRGIPTVEVDLHTNKGMFRASAPSSDASGMYEAFELLDGDKGLYLGNSVSKAVKNVNEKISEALVGMDPTLQSQIDQAMMALDKTEKKSELGVNAILAVSIAACKAGAAQKEVPLYKHIADLSGKGHLTLPVPAFTVISGGKRAGNNLAIQEIMILPIGASKFEEALQMGSETYHHLKKNMVHMDVMLVKMVVLLPTSRGTKYDLDYKSADKGQNFKSADDMIGMYKELCSGKSVSPFLFLNVCVFGVSEYPIVSVEDPFDKEDWEHTKRFSSLGICQTMVFQVVGDDLITSNPKRIKRAIEESTCNSLLIKINQIGTVTEIIEVMKLAKDAHWGVVMSHRCGETEDSFIADLAVGLSTGQIKAGAPCRGERLAKYNQLLRIEEELGDDAFYAGEDWRRSH
ncbi:cytosolic enolase 3-like isoform X5 [Pyrus x bretschneideri]|uniref:cytosolic enolase 3-like isoform X5 n=1 Tax=Pyrus x bretschneideri TaxID=225117 RepID=UPI00202FA22B|nr:cytosolic enolase 3-like isoform X5 [Pyrus x bretschneideri]